MIEQYPEEIQRCIRSLPDEPGVYQYYDKEGKILYVGKAKNLKKRVSSYFTKEQDSGRLRILLKRIREIKTIVVKSESDALLLENNLIKELQPRYNINLKDDKTYPWLCIKKERFPRIFPTRNLIRDGSDYFGPYASVKTMNTALSLIRQLFPLRTCSLHLSQENIEAGKFKTCLDYHIGTCKGPCVNLQSTENYQENIKKIKHILKGNFSEVIRELKNEMLTLSEKLEFEKAQQIKEKINTLQNYQAKSTLVSSTVKDAEVYSIISDEQTGYVNYLKVKDGAVIYGFTYEVKKKLDEDDASLLIYAIQEIRSRMDSLSKEIILPFEIEFQIPETQYIFPKAGEKKQLLDLSLRNAQQFKREKEKQAELINPERQAERVLNKMMEDLRMKELPRHIECFDNSNLQGEFAVSAMTVFKNGKPSKKDYRHFNIKTVTGPDDFASMEEVIYRRYKRVLEENLEMPQLIVVDGGKGQLASAMNSLHKLNLTGKVAIVGIAKRLEEIYFPYDSIPLYLDKKSETLRVIQRIRDEAHRFGITHHRGKRSKNLIKTELHSIPGISIKTAEKLLQEFGSVKSIREKSLEEISSVIGKAKGLSVYEYFNRENN